MTPTTANRRLETKRLIAAVRIFLRWILLAVAALAIAAIPTRVASHHVAVGIPFTWRTSQVVATVGEQPRTFSFLLLLLDFAMALLTFSAIAALIRRKDKHAD